MCVYACMCAYVFAGVKPAGVNGANWHFRGATRCLFISASDLCRERLWRENQLLLMRGLMRNVLLSISLCLLTEHSHVQIRAKEQWEINTGFRSKHWFLHCKLTRGRAGCKTDKESERGRSYLYMGQWQITGGHWVQPKGAVFRMTNSPSLRTHKMWNQMSSHYVKCTMSHVESRPSQTQLIWLF